MKMLLKQMKWKIFLLALALSCLPANLVFCPTDSCRGQLASFG